jgi:aerobic carbon-monoxide dehydrogenase medium subunit
MKPAPFSLHLPGTLQEALHLLATGSNARVIAGGQSLMPMLNLRVASADDLIDLNGIAELSGIRAERGDIVIGAMTRQRDIEFSPLVAEKLPLLREAILHVGHRQTRNRGTIGGSLCHLDPSAEQPTIAVAMDAQLTIQSAGGTRVVPMRDFAVDVLTTCLAPDEMLTSVRFTPWPAHSGYGFVEYGRRHGDFAIVSAAVLLELDGDGAVRRSSLTLGGVGAVPFRVSAAEQLLEGRQPDAETVKRACAEASTFEAMNDPDYPAWYRQRLASSLLERAFHGALDRARQLSRRMVA